MEVFTYFRFIFWFLLWMSVLVCAVVTFQKKRYLNAVGLGLILCTILGTSIILFGTEGIIVDVYALSGDDTTGTLFFVIVGFSVLTFVISIVRGALQEKRQDIP